MASEELVLPKLAWWPGRLPWSYREVPCDPHTMRLQPLVTGCCGSSLGILDGLCEVSIEEIG